MANDEHDNAQTDKEMLEKLSQIPEDVLEALELVRSSGVTNMMARQVVIQEMTNKPDTNESAREASLWLYDNPDRYMEALTAMGKRRVSERKS